MAVTASSLARQKSQRVFYSSNPAAMESPNLIRVQTESFEWFVENGIGDLFKEISPIEDFTGKNFELHFLSHTFEDPKLSVEEAKEKGATYAAPLKIDVRLINKQTGEIREQNIYLGDVPWMTDRGTFLINGAERVVVSQLIRSPGIFFSEKMDTSIGRSFSTAKVIPDRGAWLEFETNKGGLMTVKVDRKRKILVTTLLKALGVGGNDEILKMFEDVDTDEEYAYIASTLMKDSAVTQEEALLEVYRKLRPGDPPTIDGSRSYINSLFFNFRRYDLGEVGRYKVNYRFEEEVPIDIENRVLRQEDFINIVRELIKINNGQAEVDDIDHLGNRRVRRCGELIKNQFRIGLLRVERIVRERMSIIEPDKISPNLLINVKPVVAILREFFGSSQLSQFMDQTNPLSELAHKRRLSAMGPGGLSRERAGFEVRDVHHSHYGRICPIETPEGPNIGLIGAISTYAIINKYGFIETPYRQVITKVKNDGKEAVGRKAGEDILLTGEKKSIVKHGDVIDEKMAKAIAGDKEMKEVAVWPFASKEVQYYDALTEEVQKVAQANTELDELGQFMEEHVEVRHGQHYYVEQAVNCDLMDVSPKQMVGMTSALIPFLEHDDATRSLMGANMQRQAVPLLKPESPVVGTGMEFKAAVDSDQLCVCQADGVVAAIRPSEIVIKEDKSKKERAYPLVRFKRSNQGTCLNQRPLVNVGEKVAAGQAMTDSYTTSNGEIALGQNLMCAFMSFEGLNFEDAIVISDRVVRDDRFTSVHIEKFEMEVRDTKLGVEEVTRDIPNVGEDALRNLDEGGIIRVGAEVGPGDILVGKITPKGKTDLTPEERLLRAIFGEKVLEVKDTSLRVPHGYNGKVVGVRVISKDDGEDLAPGVLQSINVFVAQLRPIVVGDKLAGRHGNKGVVARIVPEADMPYLEDGTPIDIILSPLGVPSRMNLGQILEMHLGRAAGSMGIKVASPVFDGVSEEKIHELCREAGVDEDGRAVVYDGRTGEAFDNRVAVGDMYILKLHHLAEDKIHARSVGPYSLVTQQPLGGKAQFGGQRFGEMEVWALEAYGAAHTLQEMLTIKSDDVSGRIKAYEAIIKGESIDQVGIPESFGVLVKELQGIAMNVLLKDTATQQLLTVRDTIDPVGAAGGPSPVASRVHDLQKEVQDHDDTNDSDDEEDEDRDATEFDEQEPTDSDLS